MDPHASENKSNNEEVLGKLIEAITRFNKAELHQRVVDGIKPSEMMLMCEIRKTVTPESEGLKVCEISQALKVTPPTVTQLIKGLEERGFVTRTMDPNDRRAVRIKLTTEGEGQIAKSNEEIERSFEGLIEHLGIEQSHQLAELMTKAYQYYEQMSQSPDPCDEALC